MQLWVAFALNQAPAGLEPSTDLRPIISNASPRQQRRHSHTAALVKMATVMGNAIAFT